MTINSAEIPLLCTNGCAFQIYMEQEPQQVLINLSVIVYLFIFSLVFCLFGLNIIYNE